MLMFPRLPHFSSDMETHYNYKMLTKTEQKTIEQKTYAPSEQKIESRKDEAWEGRT